MSNVARQNPVGRPSLYDPKYCDLAREHMAKGFSISALAGQIGVDRVSLYEWEKVHPEFRQALGQARFMRVNALENKLLNSDAGPHVTAAIFALKNAMPDEWKDRHEVTGADGGPIAVTVMRFTDEPKMIEGQVIDERQAITEYPTANTVKPASDSD